MLNYLIDIIKSHFKRIVLPPYSVSGIHNQRLLRLRSATARFDASCQSGTQNDKYRRCPATPFPDDICVI